MAIKKSIKTELGINAEYWTIGYIEGIANKEGIRVRGRIDGYLNEKAYREGSKKIESKSFNYQGKKDFNGDIFEVSYENILELEEFKGGIKI